MHRNLPPGSRPNHPTNQSIRQTHNPRPHLHPNPPTMSPLAPPNQPITFVPAHAGDIIRIGHDLTLRVMEDGSNTDNRLGVAELILAPHATGPPAHWHEMQCTTRHSSSRTGRYGAVFRRGGERFPGKDARGRSWQRGG